MDELVRWLGKQLDADERIARAVEDRSAPWDGQWMADGNSAVRTYNGHVLFYRHGSGPLKPGLTDHVAEWDPARVLRETDAKRRLLDEHKPGSPKGRPTMERHCLTCTTAQAWDEKANEANCLTLRVLALPYSDRPGYREEWRP